MKRLLIPVLVIALGVLAYVNFTKRVELSSELRKLSISSGQTEGSSEEGIAQAKAVVEQVKEHIKILGDVEPTVASIVDVDTLRKRNAFYNNAKNGDYLIVTPTRAYLYDPDADIIVDVIPVHLTPNVPPASSSAKSR